MSESENKKVQDILREVAEIGDEGSIDDSWEHTLASLRDEVGVKSTPTWSGDLAAILREIADRIDRQSVVEVQVPPRAETKPTAIALDALEDVQDALTPTIIDVHDCFVTINVYGGNDDQD